MEDASYFSTAELCLDMVFDQGIDADITLLDGYLSGIVQKKIVHSDMADDTLLFMRGKFNTHSDNFQGESHYLAGNVKGILERSYMSASTNRVQGYSNNGYRGLVVAVDCSGVVTSVNFFSVQLTQEMPHNLCFDAYFSCGQYKRATERALFEFLPLVEAFEFADTVGEDPRYFGQGMIQIVSDGKIVASGWPAFEKLEMDVEEKPIDLVMGTYL